METSLGQVFGTGSVRVIKPWNKPWLLKKDYPPPCFVQTILKHIVHKHLKHVRFLSEFQPDWASVAHSGGQLGNIPLYWISLHRGCCWCPTKVSTPCLSCLACWMLRSHRWTLLKRITLHWGEPPSPEILTKFLNFWQRAVHSQWLTEAVTVGRSYSAIHTPELLIGLGQG